MDPSSAVEPFSVVFVCTGNRFRSVIAEAAFRAALGDLAVTVESYGTLDLGPVGPLPEAVREAQALGLEISAHVARSLGQADLTTASLVLGFELEHAVAAVAVGGARIEHVFILPELVLLLDRIGVAQRSDPIAQALENIACAQANRESEPQRVVPEIEDPFSLPESAQRAIARAVYNGAEALAVQLFGRSAAPIV